MDISKELMNMWSERRARFDKALALASLDALKLKGHKVRFTYFAPYGFAEYIGRIDGIATHHDRVHYLISDWHKEDRGPILVEKEFIIEVIT